MISIGIDIGSAQAKGIAIRVMDDGSISILGAAIMPAGELKARAEEFAGAFAKFRPTPFTRLPAATCLSHHDVRLERVRIPLAAEDGDLREETLKLRLLEGKIQAPVGARVAEDLWDLQALRFFRRASDVETYGGKFAEALFALVPKVVGEWGAIPWKTFAPAGLCPSSLGLLNAILRFTNIQKEVPTLAMEVGLHHVLGILLYDGEPLKIAQVPVENLVQHVATMLKLDPQRAEQRIQSADIALTDNSSTAIRETITKALMQVKEALVEEGAENPMKPQRLILCGGLATMKSLARHAGTILDIQTPELLGSDRVRLAVTLPAPFQVFAGALGSAIMAAGIAPLRLSPRKQEKSAIVAAASGAKPVVTRPGGPTLIERAYEIGMRVWTLPAKLGWWWVVVGAAAALALIPTARRLYTQAAQIDDTRHELEVLAPDNVELERQAALIRRYNNLTGTGPLSLTPWGEIIAELANRMPEDSYASRMNISRGRLLIQGRVKGNSGTMVRRIIEKLKSAPVLRKNGLTPPAL